MSKYRVKFIQHIITGGWSGSSTDIYLHRYMDLPFPPSGSYSYNDGDFMIDNLEWNEKKNQGEPAEISWDNEKQEFSFYMPADKTVWFDENLTAEQKVEKANKIAEEYVKEYGWHYEEELKGGQDE